MIKKTKSFLEDVKREMMKVSWPTHNELLNSTMIVVLVSAIFTAFIFLSDLLISNVIKIFY
ncbi:MAG: preprotein translocase subunit SecE [Calditrichaceae bacterium]|nr:preprotein translocase subunit SecE [Calditrichaceae bacterium]